MTEGKEIVGGKIGEGGAYDVALKDGGVCGDVAIKVGPVKLKVAVSGELDVDGMVDLVINAIEKAVPGEYENLLLEPSRALVKVELHKLLGSVNIA